MEPPETSKYTTGIFPQDIVSVEPKATYSVRTFGVTDEGLKDAGETIIRFCKGNKADPNAFRQEGFFTETLIAVSKKYLEENNVGDLENPLTTEAIVHLNEALVCIDRRAKERAARGVQGTYQK